MGGVLINENKGGKDLKFGYTIIIIIINCKQLQTTASTWYSVMRVLKHSVKRLILLIFDLSEPVAPVTAAAKYLSRRLL